MTIRIQPPSYTDRILASLGKRRAVCIPDDRASGYMLARREGFLSALLRPQGENPPAGWIYWDEPPNTSI